MINNVDMPSALPSKHLSASEKSYTTSEKEALAIVFATKVFQDCSVLNFFFAKSLNLTRK